MKSTNDKIYFDTIPTIDNAPPLPEPKALSKASPFAAPAAAPVDWKGIGEANGSCCVQ
jgi:hypothetical protein